MAGLSEGDEILAVDGKETIIWQQVTLQMLGRMGETGDLRLTINPASGDSPRDVVVPISSWLGSDTAPNPVADLGIVQIEMPAMIAGLVENGRAEQGGLLPGDEVLFVNDQAIRGWTHWVEVIRANPELELEVVVQRGVELASLSITPAEVISEEGFATGSIGAYVKQMSLAEIVPESMRREVSYGPISAIKPAVIETWDKSLFVLDSVKKMVVGLISVKNINGPITIAQVAGDTATYGLNVYLGFLALLSISLGVLNLLPIPVLDGGHLLYYSIEAVIRRPVPERIQSFGLQLGLLLISGIMVLAVYNDVSRLL
jgi:regulator of sigma E protease